MARRKKAKTSKAKISAARYSQGAIETVRTRVMAGVRDYAKAIEGVLEWLEKEIDHASSAARDQIARLLGEASKQIDALEKRGQRARKRLTAPYRQQVSKLVARLEDSLADAAASVGATAAEPKARRNKRTAKRRVAKRRVTKKRSTKKRNA